MYNVSTRKGETAVNLAFHLKNCEGGYQPPNDCNFLVNYGRTDMSGRANLNERLINNKYTQIIKFKESGLRAPNVSLIDWNRSRAYTYPVIARKYFHCKGKEAIFLKNRVSWLRRRKRVATRHYFIQYIPKETEFRVHVCGNGVIGISTKTPAGDMQQHPHIWSRDRGWYQIEYNGQHNNALRDLGIRAVRALNYDFGAVDIMLGRDGQFYLLEVNSAPRLNRRRRKLYCEYFRKKYVEEFPNR